MEESGSLKTRDNIHLNNFNFNCMVNKNLVASLELSKELHSLGVRVESEFWWVGTSEGDFILVYKTQTGYYMENGAGFNAHDFDNIEKYPALLTGELGILLPAIVYNQSPVISKHKTFYQCGYLNNEKKQTVTTLPFLKQSMSKMPE